MFFLINNKITIPSHSSVENPTTNVHITVKMNIHLLIKQRQRVKWKISLNSTSNRPWTVVNFILAFPQQTYKQPHTNALVFDPSNRKFSSFFYSIPLQRSTLHTAFKFQLHPIRRFGLLDR